jgi:hypothetical protein
MDDNNLIQQSIAALKQDINQARIVAAEPTTNPEILRELALFDDEKTREAVVSNANSPPEVLVQLGEQFPSQFLDNPVFPLLLLENPNFIRELPLFTLWSILQQENVPEYILEQAADKADAPVQLALANNVKTSKAILNRLNQSRNSEVVEAVNLHVNFVGELTEGFEEKVKEIVPKSIGSSHRVDYRILAVLAQICWIPEFIIKHWVEEFNYKDLVCRKLADSPATPPLILKLLASHRDIGILEAIAQNINTPEETLKELVNQGKKISRSLIAGNPSTPADVLEYLSKNKSASVRSSIAENPNTPRNVLEQLAKDTVKGIAETAKQMIGERKGEYGFVTIYGGKGISSTMAERFKALGMYRYSKTILNPRTTPQALKKLVRKDPINVAKHQNTPPEVLLKLSQSDDVSIRQAVAINPSVPISILEKLANDDSYKVRWKVAENPSTPINLLFKQLARDTKVINAIANQMSSKVSGTNIDAETIIDILGEYCSNPVEIILQALASRGGYFARLFLASRFDLPADLLAQLAQTNDLRLLKTIAGNPNTPTDTLEKLINDDSAEIREKVFQNSGFSEEMVIRILCSPNASYYLKLNPDCLSRYPDIRASVINYYANTKSSSMWVNFITLIQPEVNQELLQKKSNSIFWLERLAVSQNYLASKNILEKLTEDCNQVVRAAAINTLQQIS